jgi:hypothetical protein
MLVKILYTTVVGAQIIEQAGSCHLRLVAV